MAKGRAGGDHYDNIVIFQLQTNLLQSSINVRNCHNDAVKGGEGGGALPLHPVRPPRLPDLPPLSVPGGAHCQCGDERDAGRLVAPGVRQQPRRQAHRSVVSTKGMSVMLM